MDEGVVVAVEARPQHSGVVGEGALLAEEALKVEEAEELKVAVEDCIIGAEVQSAWELTRMRMF